MKKRIQTLMFLTLMAFLFSGLTSLSAQSLSASPAVYNGVDGKTTFDLVDNAEAIAIVESEITTNYQLDLPPPTNQVEAEIYYQLEYLISVRGHLGAGQTTITAIATGYNDVVNMSKSNWPNLVDQTWMDDMLLLLSN